MKTKSLALALVLVLGCTTMQDTSPAAAETAPARPSEFKNLKVLPPDIPRDELIATMRSFAQGLGVKCDHCHVVTATTPKQELDFPSDAKEEKRAARVMLQMVMQINNEWLPRVEQAEHPERAMERPAPGAPLRVVCWTCHRGMPEPDMPPPPPNAR